MRISLQQQQQQKTKEEKEREKKRTHEIKTNFQFCLFIPTIEKKRSGTAIYLLTFLSCIEIII